MRTLKKILFSKSWPLVSRLYGVDTVFRIGGGLGNQIFQYAAALAYEKNTGVRVALDLSNSDNQHNGWEIDRVFDLGKKLRVLPTGASKVLWRCAKYGESGRLLREPFDGNSLVFKEKLLKTPILGVIKGFFPSYKYYEEYEDEILPNFKFANTEKIDLMGIDSSRPSVALHVRRGDFLKATGYGGICTTEYYDAALSYMRGQCPDAKYYIFSNDPEWCREYFKGDEFVIVDVNSGKDSWKDMYMMSRCDHYIIANSSFSFWGMELGKSEDSICVGPKYLMYGGPYKTKIEDFLAPRFKMFSPEGEEYLRDNSE